MRHYQTHNTKFVATIRVDVRDYFLDTNKTIRIEDQTIDGVIGFKYSITCQTACRRKIYGRGVKDAVVNDIDETDPYRIGTTEYNVRVQNARDIVYTKYANREYIIIHNDLHDTRGAIKKGKAVIFIEATYELPPKCIELNARQQSTDDTSDKSVQVNVFELVNGSDDTSDLEIVIDGQKIKAHKGFLSMISPVFNAMFTHNTKEAQTGVITIKDFDHATVKAAIDLLYGHPVEPTSAYQAVHLLRFAEKYIIKVVVNRLETWLMDKITTDAFPLIIQHAWDHSSEKLKAACGSFYYRNMEIGTRSDFKQLDENVLKELAAIAADHGSQSLSRLRF